MANKALIVSLFLTAAFATQQSGAAFLDVDDSLAGWKPVCILPTCNPGGSGIPTATAQTVDNATPSKDGSSMKVSVSGPSYTNALWTHIAERNDARHAFSLSAWVSPTQSASVAGQFEYDLFQFSSSTHVEYMWGTQCNQASGSWQIFDQLNGHWENIPVPCSLPANQWNYIRWDVHRVVGDTNSCSGMPCMHYDRFTVNNVVYAVNVAYPAGHLPNGWSSANGFQVQIDIGSTNQDVTVDEFLDEANFSTL
jgi:hypothetical protein